MVLVLAFSASATDSVPVKSFGIATDNAYYWESFSPEHFRDSLTRFIASSPQDAESASSAESTAVVSAEQSNDVNEEQKEYEDNQILVKYKESAINENLPEAEQKESVRASIAEIVEDSDESIVEVTPSLEGEFAAVEIENGAQMEDAIAALESSDLVEYAEPMALYHATESAWNDPYFLGNWQWGYNAVESDSLWHDTAVQQNLSDVTIAIVDCGVDIHHEDLSANIVPGYNFVENTEDTTNYGDGHGTHVAGIAAAIGQNGKGIVGVAGGAKIMPVRVLNDEGKGTVLDVINGVLYAVNHGADIINLSLGGDIASKAMDEVIAYAVDSGVLVVAAAGNEYSKDSVIYPAACDDVLVVSGIYYDGQDFRELSYANNDADLSQRLIHAPGYYIYSTYVNNGYDFLAGTSMATPFASGMAALFKAKNPDWDGQDLLNALMGASYQQKYQFNDKNGKKQTDSSRTMSILDDNGTKNADIYFKRFALENKTSYGTEDATVNIMAENKMGETDTTVSAEGTLSYYKAVYDPEKGYVIAVGEKAQEAHFQVDAGVGTATMDLSRYKEGDVIVLQALESGGLYASEKMAAVVGSYAQQEFCIQLPDGYDAVPAGMTIDAYRNSNGSYYEYSSIPCTYDATKRAFVATVSLPYGDYVFEYTMDDGLTNPDMDCYIFNEYIGCVVEGDNATVTSPAKLFNQNPEAITATVAVVSGYQPGKTVFDIAKPLTPEGKEYSLLFADYGEAKWFKIDTNGLGSSGYSLEFSSYSDNPTNQDTELLYWELYRRDGEKLVRVDDNKILVTKKYVQRTMYQLFAWSSKDVAEGEYYVRIKGGDNFAIDSGLRLVKAPVVNVAIDLPAQSNLGIVAVTDKGGAFAYETQNTDGEAKAAAIAIPIPTGDTIKLEYIDQSYDYSLPYSLYGCYTGSGMSSSPAQAKYVEVKNLQAAIPMSVLDKSAIVDDYAGADTPISLNKLQKGTLDYFEDEDWFSFTADKADTYSFRAQCNIYCILDVYKKTASDDAFIYTLVNDNANAQGTGSIPLEVGEYRLKVSNYGMYLPTVLADGSYSLIVNTSDGINVDPEPEPEPEPPASALFDDVAASHWAYADIEALATRGILLGRSAKQFVPEGVVTRAEFLTILYRLNSDSELPDGKTPFKDVDKNAWYAPYIAWGFDKGIVNGVSTDRFNPDEKISRQDMSVMLFRYAGQMGISLPAGIAAGTFPDDGSIWGYAKTAVYAMKAADILRGRDTGLFDPLGNASRAEAAAVANRLRCYVPTEEGGLTFTISNNGSIKDNVYTLKVEGTVGNGNNSEIVKAAFIDDAGITVKEKEAAISNHTFSFTVDGLPSGSYEVTVTAGDESKTASYTTVDVKKEALQELLLSFPANKKAADAITDESLPDLKSDIDEAKALITQLIADGVDPLAIKGDVNDGTTVIGGMENYLGLGFAMQRIDRFWWEVSYIFNGLRDEEEGGGQYADVDFDMETKNITIQLLKDELIGGIFDGHHLGEFNVIYDRPILFTPEKLEIANIRIMPYTVLDDPGMGILSVAGKRNILYAFAKAAGKTDISDVYLSDLTGTVCKAQTANGNAYTLQFTGDTVTAGMLQREISAAQELPVDLYTEASLKNLQRAITDAKEIVAKENPPQSLLGSAYTKLLDAKNKLKNVNTIDRSALENLIKTAAAIKKGDMPQSFYQYMLDVKATAAAVAANGTAAEIRSAYNDLYTAIKEGEKGQGKLDAYQALLLLLPANESNAAVISDYDQLKSLYEKVAAAENAIRCYGILQQDLDEANFASGGRVDIALNRLDEMEKALLVWEEAKFVLIPNYRYGYDIPSDAAVVPTMDLAANTLVIHVQKADTPLADILDGGRLKMYQRESKVAARYPSVIFVGDERIAVGPGTVVIPNAEVRAALASLAGKTDFNQVTVADLAGKTGLSMSFTEDDKTITYQIRFVL